MSPEEQRPDPDALLAYAQRQERKQTPGRLRIFLGAAPGVGKTYSMLEAARAKRTEGLDVVAGVVESHGRAETEALLQGLELIPRRQVPHRGVILAEFDLDAALARRPALILVDELAHANAPGSRHPKRWQDVRELLDSGIDVYTTLNIQHVESRNDVVAQVTGVIIRETVPDSLLEDAESLVLVDLPPEDLLTRLKEGKVYIPQQAEWAAQNYFRPGNLASLRELALRMTAERVGSEVLVYRQGQAAPATWPTGERLLVCVGPAPSSAKLIRAAKRMAEGLHAPWLALYVETAEMARLPQEERNRAIQHLQLARQLGAETVTLSGGRVAEEVVHFARARNVSKIIIGKPLRPAWKDRIFGNFVDEVIRLSGEIDVYVIRGQAEPGPRTSSSPVRPPTDWTGYLASLAIVALGTGLGSLVRPYLEPSNLIMIYLLGVMIAAIRWGRGAAVLGSLFSVLAFDFFFVPPFYTFAVADTQYLITFAVMLLVALVISHFTSLIQRQAQTARHLQRRTESLRALSGQLAGTRGAEMLLSIAVRHAEEIFESQVRGLMPDEQGQLVIVAGPQGGPIPDAKERSVAQWAFDLGQVAGWGTETLPYVGALYVPLLGLEGPVGALEVRPQDPQRLFSPEQMRLLDAIAKQVALALEVDRLEKSTLKAQLDMETEQMRSSLLSSVTHDFQTPLAAVLGSASSILEIGPNLSLADIRGLVENIYDEAERLSRLINNLLKVTKLESGALALHKELQPLEELVGSALNRLERRLTQRHLHISLPEDLPMAPMDGPLVEQVFLNLLENALKYTPEGTPLSIAAQARDNELEVEVADQGPGLPGEDLENIFEMYYRGSAKNSQNGYGLGLAICKAIVRAHGGRIWADNLPGGGAAFRFTLPLAADDTP